MKKSTFCTVIITVSGASLIALAGQGFAQSGLSMGSEPAGIGEKGTGQTQSSLERSGGTQGKSNSQGMTSEPAGIGEKGTGQTQNTLDRSGGVESRNSQGTTSEPAGIGDKGTGQTQSSMERSGRGQTNR